MRSSLDADQVDVGEGLRIGFDGSALAQPWWTGVELAFVDALAAVRGVALRAELTVFAPRRPAAALPAGIDFERVAAPRACWRLRALPARLRDRAIDVWHSPVTALPWHGPCPSLATVHELPWHEPGVARDAGSGFRQRFRLWCTARSATLVLVPSQHTESRLLASHPRLAGRVRVVPHGIDPTRFRSTAAQVAATCARFDLQPDRYLLALGAARQRKNLEFLARAHRLAAGLAADLPPLCVLGPPDRYVPAQDLPAILAGARALVYPSLSEGFGLPPLEAMAAGTPVLASNRGAIPEVAGDAALLCGVENEARFAEAIVRIHRDESLRTELRRRGAARVTGFRLESTARRWLALWREVAR